MGLSHSKGIPNNLVTTFHLNSINSSAVFCFRSPKEMATHDPPPPVLPLVSGISHLKYSVLLSVSQRWALKNQKAIFETGNSFYFKWFF